MIIGIINYDLTSSSLGRLIALVVQVLVDQAFHVHAAAREDSFEVYRAKSNGMPTVVRGVRVHGHLLLGLLGIQLRDVLL